MRYMTTLLCLLLGLSFAGCKSLVTESCEKSKECGEFEDGETVAQCEKDSNAKRDKLENDSDCSDVLAKSDTLAECHNGLSCADRKEILSDDYKCSAEFKNAFRAAVAAGDSCDP